MPKVVLQTTLTSTKVCKGCNLDLPMNNYYKATPKALATLCKPCHNTKRMQHAKDNKKAKKPVGFSKLGLTIRTEILKDITEGMKYKKIASKHSLNYITLLRWKESNLLR
jgi:hypothetical protein